MTDIDKSPEQLDAEAAAPVNLDGAIALHRALSQAELFIFRLHSRNGEPESLERSLKLRRVGKVGRHCRLDRGDGWTGLPFAPHFVRFLDGSYGSAFPWSNGLQALRRECRKSHSEHWHRPEWHGSLCNRLVHLVIREGWSFDRACYELYVTPDRTQRVFLNGLRRIEQRLDEIQSRETEVVKSTEGRHDWMAPAHVHHPLGGAHAEECNNPVCRAARAA